MEKKLGPDYEGPLMPFKGFCLLSCRQLEAVEGLKQRNDTSGSLLLFLCYFHSDISIEGRFGKKLGSRRLETEQLVRKLFC